MWRDRRTLNTVYDILNGTVTSTLDDRVDDVIVTSTLDDRVDDVIVTSTLDDRVDDVIVSLNRESVYMTTT